MIVSTNPHPAGLCPDSRRGRLRASIRDRRCTRRPAALTRCDAATPFARRRSRPVVATPHGEHDSRIVCVHPIALAASRGARVIGVDVSRGARALASAAGASVTLDPAAGDVVDAVRALLPAGVDVSVDALGSPETASAAVRSLRIHGRHVQVGLLVPAVVGDHATVPMHTVIAREIHVIGSHGMASSAFPRLLAEIAAGALDPGRFISRTITLDEAPAALMAMSGDPGPGVTIIQP